MLFRCVLSEQHLGRRLVSFPRHISQLSLFFFFFFVIPLGLPTRSPIVPGHEIIGRVAEVGEGVAPWKIGDRVGGGWHGGHDGKYRHLVAVFLFAKVICSLVSIGTCYTCKKGWNQMCDNQVINGETKAGGCK